MNFPPSKKSSEWDNNMVVSLKARPAEPIAPTPKEKPTLRKKSPLLLAVFFAIGLGIIAGTGVFWFTHHGVSRLSGQKKTVHEATSTTPTTEATLLERVGKLMTLPPEEPSIAVVSNINSLKGQLFFAKAKNGDFVLMFPKAGRAILYDAVADKILEVGPITNTPQ